MENKNKLVTSLLETEGLFNEKDLATFLLKHKDKYVYVISKDVKELLFQGKGHDLFWLIGTLFTKMDVLEYCKINSHEYSVIIDLDIVGDDKDAKRN